MTHRSLESPTRPASLAFLIIHYVLGSVLRTLAVLIWVSFLSEGPFLSYSSCLESSSPLCPTRKHHSPLKIRLTLRVLLEFWPSTDSISGHLCHFVLNQHLPSPSPSQWMSCLQICNLVDAWISVSALNSWVGKIPNQEKEMATTPVFLPGESYGQRSLAGYSLWGHRSRARLSI